ncbi:hypothetical protein ACE38W_14940 [Chitinophaga sp. Hz27]|uniref:hypothetical protein n=1 Tax=Chitinophaga sp. Hz27 TaxID=3347169 RepID=UPI0035DDD04A
MSIYNIDTGQKAIEATPPDKRYPIFIHWLLALFKPLQWLADLSFSSYRTGSNAVSWISGVVYYKYDRVLFKQTVYESLTDNNTLVPTDQSGWMVVQQNFVGVFERILYNGNKLVFEYAINKYFGSMFRQPPGISDIYTENKVKPLNVFVVGGTERISSITYSSYSNEFIINQYVFSPFSNLIIYVPVAVFHSIDTDPMNAERIIRNFADQYLVAGIIYTVQTY